MSLNNFAPFIEAAMNPSPTVLSIGLIFLVVFPIVLHFLYSFITPSNNLPPSVLLIGPQTSGKTTLVTLFSNPSTPSKTHTSSTPSSTELSISDNDDKKFLLIDTPGHPKLRARSVLAPLSSPDSKITIPGHDHNEKSPLKAVIFLVDSAALADSDTLPQTAEYLYDVLLALQNRFHSRKGARAPSSMPVLIAANKMDLFTALPPTLVKSILEAELGRIRTARSKGLLDSGVGQDDDLTEERDDSWLGGDGSEKFKFEQMMEFDVEVEVIGGNVIGDGPGVDKWWKWVGERV
ncbi:putative signal recognition particle receptor subunit beta [Podospora fimiseda]|uniref:Signal recognition particle receptor subunit beta n=1 Tax=Podospora fimiseda TaxID=252190 RepID=A0AAN7BKY6_9PEZI|nr:putative signal recognition particle receptor subunit beta [Podospora fimiseda]